MNITKQKEGLFLFFVFLFFLFPFFFFLLFFLDRVSLYSPGCPGTHSVDQAGLELKNLPASASQVPGFFVCLFVFETGFLCVALAVLELTL